MQQQHRAQQHQQAPTSTDAPTPPLLTFSAGEVARITGLDHNTIQQWCRAGWIQAHHPGTPGGFDPKRFSAYQLVGLAFLGAAHRRLRAQRTYLGKHIVMAVARLFEQRTDDWPQLARLLMADKGCGDLYTEELMAARNAAAPLVGSSGDGFSPEEAAAILRVVNELKRRLNRWADRLKPRATL
jgi:hypothetical protein